MHGADSKSCGGWYSQTIENNPLRFHHPQHVVNGSRDYLPPALAVLRVRHEAPDKDFVAVENKSISRRPN